MRIRSTAIFVLVVLFLFGAPAFGAVTEAVKAVVSPPLRTLTEPLNDVEVKKLVPNRAVKAPARPAGVAAPADPAVQNGLGPNGRSPDVIGVNFDGVGVSNSAPPDTTGDVGPNHYVQWVNTQLAVYDKQGNLLYGPVKGNTLFQALGGPCALHNNGDPIVQYDIQADRWVLTQFVVNAAGSSASRQCFAVSMNGDPLGGYYLYDFPTSPEWDPLTFVDYPHVGVWSDGYYMTTHQFDTSEDFQGIYVFDRVAMLSGMPAAMQYTTLGASAPALFVYGGALPADLDSLRPPPPGSPAYIVQHGSPDTDGSTGFVVHLWKIKTTWGASPALNVTGPINVPVAPFNGELCTPFLPIGIGLGSRPCVPQATPVIVPDPNAPTAPVVDTWLDGVSERLMYRVAYYNYGTHESLVLNHTVNAGVHQAGVRWYELRNPSAPVLHQQGTFAGTSPNQEHRWMGSVALDNSGNMLVGYSKSSATTATSIEVAGRKSDDPLGVLGPEILMKASGGVQIGTGNRWGDYSTMNIDPRDGCTFWFTTEYIPADGSFNWKTRIGSFRYSSCTPPPQGRIEGVVTDCATGAPVSRATVEVSNGFSGATDANGRYSIVVPPGSYTILATAPARYCAPSASGAITVGNGATVTRNFCVTGSPRFDYVSSSIDDSAGSGNGAVNRDECVKLAISVANNGCGIATNVRGTLSTTTPGVTIGRANAAFGNMPRDASASAAEPFVFSTSTADGFVCGNPIDFTVSFTSNEGAGSLHFSVPTCAGASIAKSGSLTAQDTPQNVRLGRDSSPSVCGMQKACPDPLGTGVRYFDGYTFTNASTVDTCVTVNVSADASCNGVNQVFSAAYLDSYDPQNLCTNYLADEGSSPDLGFSDYSFVVPAGRDFVVMISTVSEGGQCVGYNLNVSGLIDNATSGNGACPQPPVTTCIEDNDASIAYDKGWHLVASANASDGHFRLAGGNNNGTAASVTVTVPPASTGALTYHYATSTKGGSADVYIDGAMRGTISYKGSAGSAKDPVFGSSARYDGLAAGAHTFELRNTKGSVYVDGFCLESAASTGTPTAGPGATTTGGGNASASQSLIQTVAVPANARSLSVIVESSLAVPMQLVVLSPAGALLSSVTSTNGLAAIDVPVSAGGMYVVKTVNLSLGPLSVWTAATPQVTR